VTKIFPDIREIPEIRGVAEKKSCFWGACQEYIIDNKAPGARFDQCLRGFRVLKKSVMMTCTISTLCAKILK
jgi:hypothetical protein